MAAIGGYTMISVRGVVAPPAEMLTRVTRPGVDGQAYKEEGAHGSEVQLLSVVDLASAAAAQSEIPELLGARRRARHGDGRRGPLLDKRRGAGRARGDAAVLPARGGRPVRRPLARLGDVDGGGDRIMITLEAPARVGGNSWRFSWTSDGEGPFYVYDLAAGALVAVTTETSLTVTLEAGESAVLEVRESALSAVPRGLPGRVTLYWHGADDAASYLVEEKVSGVSDAARAHSRRRPRPLPLALALSRGCDDARVSRDGRGAQRQFGDRARVGGPDGEVSRSPGRRLLVRRGDRSGDDKRKLTL